MITRGWFKGGAVVGGWSLEGGVVFPLFSDGSAAVRGWQLGWRLGVLFDVGGEGSTVIVSRRLEDGVEGSAVIESRRFEGGAVTGGSFFDGSPCCRR